MIEGIPVLDYTAETLLGIVLILIFIGKLVPAWYIRQLEKRVASLEDTNRELLEQNSELMETTRIARSTWVALSEGVKDT